MISIQLLVVHPAKIFLLPARGMRRGGRANLTLSFAETINILRPDFFIMENVDRAQKTKTFAEALAIFKGAGYGVTAAVLEASLCGIPQKRKRVMVIGILNGADNILIPAIQKNQASKLMTIRDYFGGKFGIENITRGILAVMREEPFSV